ncbi:MAG TPA: hypothetical protein VMZ92_15065 [Planctomycetota bacterium]|nr:hypothetical protein [Planctomycetota bacterium]
MQVERPLRRLVRISLIPGILSVIGVVSFRTHAQEASTPVLVERVVREWTDPWGEARHDMRISPTGRQLCYRSRHDNRWRIVIQDMVRDRTSCALDAVVDGPIFSPDGEHVVYVGELDGKQLIIRDGVEHVGPTRYDQVAGRDSDDKPLFSPDSRHLAYRARSGGKWVCVLDGNEGPKYDLVEQIRFSADSRHLAYVAGRAGREFVVRDGKEGPPYDEVCIYDIAPDGLRLAYVGHRDGKKLVVCDGRESPPYDDIGRVRLSPDGRRLAYAAKRAEKWFIVVDGEEGPAYDRLIYVEFSPDSRHLAYSTQRDHRSFVVLDGQEQTPPGDWPHFSPDSRLVYAAYHRETETWSYVYDGKLWPCGTSPERFSQPIPMAFRPDGRQFAYYAYESGKGLWIVRDGRPGKVFRMVHRPEWSPDGNHLFYTAWRKGGPNYVVCDDMVNAVGGSAYWPTFSEDSRHFAYRIREKDVGDRVVCDGVKGPAHPEIRGLRAAAGKLHYVAYERKGVRIVEVDWPAGRTWRDGFKAIDD